LHPLESHDCLTNFIDALRRHGGDPRETAPGQWKALCPAHDDSTPSLSVTRGDDGRVLAYCHGECENAQVLKTLGLSPQDMFPRPSDQTIPRRAKNKEKPIYPSPESAIKWLVSKYGPPTSFYVYESSDGAEVFRVYRFDFTDAKTGKPDKEFRPVCPTEKGWVLGKPTGPLPLYRLPEVIQATTVWVCEGEKAADALRELGVTATTSAFGAKSPRKTDWSVLSGKEVILMPDNDEPGEKYMQKVQELLTKRKPHPKIKIMRLPKVWQSEEDIPTGADAVEFIELDMPKDWSNADRLEYLEFLVQTTKPVETEWPSTPEPVDSEEEDDDGEIDPLDDGDHVTSGKRVPNENKNETQVQLVLLIASAAELFHTPDGKRYATVRREGRPEHLAIGSKAFKDWLTHEFYLKHKKPPSNLLLLSAIGVLEAKAYYEGPTRTVFVRVAEQDGTHYIDLVNDARQAIAIDQDGWRIVDDPPVAFRRSSGLMPLQQPTQDGSLDQLRDLVNLGTEADWLMFVALLTFYLRHSGPFPIMVLLGEQGCAKSTTARIVRLLVDPHAVPLKSEPRDLRDFIISANNAWLMVMDNISRLTPWLSDALCRLATGGGFSTRQLYANEDEALFDVQRPVVLNGITEIVERPDLADRSIFFYLPVIPEEKRRDEAEVKSAIKLALPGVLGALLDTVAAARKLLPHIKLHRKPRMADFALWGEAVCQAMGKPPGEFMTAYTSNRRDASSLIVDDDPVAVHLRKFMEGRSEWEGTARELRDELTELGGDSVKRQKDWPTSPRGMSGALRRLAPALRSNGIDLAFGDRKGGGRNQRLIHIRYSVSSEDNQPKEQPAQPAGVQGAASSGKPQESMCGRPADNGSGTLATSIVQGDSVLSFLTRQPGADGADGADALGSGTNVNVEVF